MEEIFPVFDKLTIAESYLKFFDTADIINRRHESRPKAVVSTSLYWGTHSPHLHKHTRPTLEKLQTPHIAVRNGESWWNNYFEPFLKGCREQLPLDWIHRVYLAGDLAFLIEYIPPSVEIHLMAESSWTSMPGMMWRYLPMEEPTLCIARGADNYELADYRHVISLALCLGTFLVRNTITFWRDDQSRFVYRTIQGSCAVLGPLPFIPAAAAWIEFNQKELPQSQVNAFPELRHVGLGHWGAYGQDEQFLSRWLYYRAASEPTITLVQPDGNHEVFIRDMAFLQANGNLHSVIRR